LPIGEGISYYVQNHKDMKKYEKAIEEGKLPVQRGIKLNTDDIIRKSVIMELMANFRLDIKRIEKEFGINFKEYFKDAIEGLRDFEREDLLSIDDDFIKVSYTGSMLVRNIAMPFDAYLKKIPPEKRKFSKTV